MPRVPTHVVKDRSRRLTRLFEGFRPYAGMGGGVEVDVSEFVGLVLWLVICVDVRVR